MLPVTGTTAGLAAATAGPASTTPPSRATARMHATVTRLAAADFTGRRVGTAGGHAAAWLADQLRQAGGSVTLDHYPVAGAVRDLYATPVLTYTDHTGRYVLRHRRDFCEHLASADQPTPVTGRLAAPDEHVTGAWVVLDTAYDNHTALQLAARGAAGLLVARGADADGWMPKVIAGPAAGPLPVLALHTDRHRRMTTDRGTLTACVPLRTVDVDAVNVHAVFSPPRPHRPDVLLTAHFDGVGDDPQQRLPAAADNASGVAAILEAARQLAAEDLDIGLAVALLDAEEAGTHGSARHAPRLPAATMVINLDGAAALQEAAAVEAAGPAHTLLAALDQAARDAGVPLRGQAMPSDNRRYGAAGLPAVGVGGRLDWHPAEGDGPDLPGVG